MRSKLKQQNAHEKLPGDNELEKVEIEQEVQEEKFEVNTLAEFLDSLKWKFDECEDDELKAKIGHQIFKIEFGLIAAGLSADDVKIKVMPDGVLGTFDTHNHEISASKEMLEDFTTDSQLLKTVFIHEKVHREGIWDEGLAQIRVRKMTSAVPGIYEEEQSKARRTFFKEGIDKALSLYDIDHPEKLFEYYLDIELKKYEKDVKGKGRNRRSMDLYKEKANQEFTRKFGKGAEELLEKLIGKGIDKNKLITKKLRDLSIE